MLLVCLVVRIASSLLRIVPMEKASTVGWASGRASGP